MVEYDSNIVYGSLWNKALCCNLVYDEFFFNEIFVAGTHRSILHDTHWSWGSKKNATVPYLAHQATSSTILQYRLHLSATLPPQSIQQPLWKHKTSAEFTKVYSSHSYRHRLNDNIHRTHGSGPPLLIMTLQLPNANGSERSASSSLASADNTPYCLMCLNTTSLTSPCTLVPEQLHMRLIDQRFAILPGLLSRQPNQPYRLLRRNFWSSKRRRSPPPSHTAQWLVTAAARPTVCKAVLSNSPLLPVKNQKEGGKTSWALQKLRPYSWWHRPEQVEKRPFDNSRHRSCHCCQNLHPSYSRECHSSFQNTPSTGIWGLP